MSIQSSAGLQFVKDLKSALGIDSTGQPNGNWDTTKGGKIPKIEHIWDEAIVRYNDTDSYILIQLDRETPEVFSHKQSDNTFDYLHELSFTLDIRTNKNEDRFEQILNYALHLMKNNVLLTSYVDIIPSGDMVYDNTVRNMWRVTVGFRVLKYNPTKTI